MMAMPQEIKFFGTHKAIKRFRAFAYAASKNNTKTCWVLKCDIRKFFASINYEILLQILREYIFDEKIICLLENIVKSFSSEIKIYPHCATEPHPSPLLSKERGKEGLELFYLFDKEKELTQIGLPLGNLTSQLFVNIYMNKFDQFVKHKLKEKYYIRYADDFVIFLEDKNRLMKQIVLIREFLHHELKLELHPRKISIETIASGVDFLGWINFPDHRVLRTATKRRMMKRTKERPTVETLNSYLGLLKYGNGRKLISIQVQKSINQSILQIKKIKVYWEYEQYS